MEYREIMRAEMAPDVYDGPTCDGIRPRWVGSAEGDKDGPDEVGKDGTILFSAKTFPPGAVVTVSLPVCPKCGETADHIQWQCGCDFDWREFALDNYS